MAYNRLISLYAKSKKISRPFRGGASFVGCLCHVCVVLSPLFVLPCGHLGDDLLALVCDVYCDFVTFHFGILGHVWYLIVSVPGPCCISYL